MTKQTAFEDITRAQQIIMDAIDKTTRANLAAVEKMMDLIIDLAGPHRKIRLRWFIIENVTGLTKKVGGKDPMIWHV